MLDLRVAAAGLPCAKNRARIIRNPKPEISMASLPISELEGLHVTVDRVAFVPHIDAPKERPFPFVYFITIHNDSSETVTIKGRKWVVADTAGSTIVVEGDGVVGKFPRIEPGAHFSYNSYHTIGADSVADGAFFGVTEDGAAVAVRIPRFEMKVPAANS